MSYDIQFLIEAGKRIIKVVSPLALTEAKKYWNGNHGSKVKIGAFQECKIEMFGDKACIVVDEDNGELVFLTDETVQSCQFDKEKFRKLKMKKYYYYEITFIDGNKSYIRVSSKYNDAILHYVSCID